jgi:queuine tRNA-ribosyltransferase
VNAFAFELLARDGRARAGILHTPHGPVPTPCFMPVGTRGTVKGMTPAMLRELGASMLLANAYHLHLRPGEEAVAELGGLHRFMGWDGALLTDSGGFQVHSLGALVDVDDDGATLRSVVDGAPVRFTPERAVAIQRALGADFAMAFDDCPSQPLERAAVERSTARSSAWLERAVRAWRGEHGAPERQALLGIVQGGAFPDLRARSAAHAAALDLPGYAVGGVSVGEPLDAALAAIDSAVAELPAAKPRYLMGVGTPEDFFAAVARGIDMFDCVTPTRNARNHQAFTSAGRLNLRNARWARDPAPLDPECDCATCRRFARGALRHFAQSDELLGAILLTHHNLRFFQRLMEELRAAIAGGALAALEARWRGAFRAAGDQRDL